MITTDTMRALVERHFLEILNGCRPDLVDDSYASDMVARDPMGILEGRDQFRSWVAQVNQAFPDHRFAINYTIVEDETVVCRFTARGTYRQPYLNQSPTDHKFVMNAAALFRFAASQIAEIEVVYDARVFTDELGTAPPTISGV